MNDRTEEQLDLIYEPLQQQLRDDYDFARVISSAKMPSYLTWLTYMLDGVNDAIANFKEQE